MQQVVNQCLPVANHDGKSRVETRIEKPTTVTSTPSAFFVRRPSEPTWTSRRELKSPEYGTGHRRLQCMPCPWLAVEVKRAIVGARVASY
jgi:hypothetical protein